MVLLAREMVAGVCPATPWCHYQITAPVCYFRQHWTSHSLPPVCTRRGGPTSSVCLPTLTHPGYLLNVF